LGIAVEAKQNESPQHVTKVKMYKGTLTQVSEDNSNALRTRCAIKTRRPGLVDRASGTRGMEFLKNSKQPEEQRGDKPIPGGSGSECNCHACRWKKLSALQDVQISNLTDDQILYFSNKEASRGDGGRAEEISTQKAAVASWSRKWKTAEGH